MHPIERQSDRFAFAHPSLARLAAEQDAAEELPDDTEIEAMLRGPRITPGMLRS